MCTVVHMECTNGRQRIVEQSRKPETRPFRIGLALCSLIASSRFHGLSVLAFKFSLCICCTVVHCTTQRCTAVHCTVYSMLLLSILFVENWRHRACCVRSAAESTFIYTNCSRTQVSNVEPSGCMGAEAEDDPGGRRSVVPWPPRPNTGA